VSELATQTSTCAQCGAPWREESAACWLCGHDPAEPAQTVPPPRPPAARQPFSFSLETMFVVTTLVAVLFGVCLIAPGIGFLLCILSLPAFLRTIMVVRRRDQIGRPVHRFERMLLFLGSIVTLYIVMMMALVASVGVFCYVCIATYSAKVSDGSAMILALMAASVTTLVAAFLAFKWFRARWRKHTLPADSHRNGGSPKP